eukprot:1003524-Rhodomonas_salina.2
MKRRVASLHALTAGTEAASEARGRRPGRMLRLRLTTSLARRVSAKGKARHDGAVFKSGKVTSGSGRSGWLSRAGSWSSRKRNAMNLNVRRRSSTGVDCSSRSEHVQTLQSTNVYAVNGMRD